MKKTTCVFCLLSFVLTPVFAVELPKELAECTSFAKGGKPVRVAFGSTIGSAVRAGDMATVNKLLDRLAAEPVKDVYGYWLEAASAFNAAAKDARRFKPEASRQLLNDFIETGSTFGLNTGLLEKETDVDLGAKLAEAARGILLKRMPQQDLTLGQKLMRDRDVFKLACDSERFPGKQAAFAQYEKTVFATVPTTAAETNAVKAGFDVVLDRYRALRDWKGWNAAWDRILATKRYPDDRLCSLADKLGVAFICSDEAEFNRLAAELDKEPLDAKTWGVVTRAVKGFEREQWSEPSVARLQKRFVDNRAKLDDALHMKVLEVMAEQATTTSYRWAPPKPIEPLRAIVDEAKAVADKTRGKRGAVSDQGVRRVYDAYLNLTQRFDELEPIWRERGDHVALANLAWKRGEKAAFEAEYAIAVTNVRLNVRDKKKLELMKAVSDANDQQDFAARIEAMCGKEGTEEERFCRLRDLCLQLYRLDCTPKNYPFLQTAIKKSNELLWPAEDVWYVATYRPNAPATASAAYEADIFSKLKVDDRIGRFNVWNRMGDHNGFERRLAKSNPQPNLHATEPGKEGRVCACYDDRGVHFYVRLNDPEAWKTRMGLKDGLYGETTVQTGDEASWHWTIFTALRPEPTADVEWDSPQYGRKMTHDYLKHDVFVGQDCFVIHIFTPWTVGYDHMPFGKDGLWRFGFTARWAGVMGSIGGGATHELGHCMNVRFDFSGEGGRVARIGLLRTAAGEYRKFRKAWENADFLADPSMGDPDYFWEHVSPYLKKLDAAADETEGELDEATLKRLEGFLADFSDTRLKLDDMRANYLRAKRFAE